MHLPSLSERLEDIPLLANSLLMRVAPSGKFTLTGQAQKKLMAHNYKGNIRELRNILSRAIVLEDTQAIDADTIEACFFDQAAHTEKKSDKVQVEMDLKTLEQEYIAELMAKHEGNKEKVAGILGISQRSLYRKLEAMD